MTICHLSLFFLPEIGYNGMQLTLCPKWGAGRPADIFCEGYCTYEDEETAEKLFAILWKV